MVKKEETHWLLPFILPVKSSQFVGEMLLRDDFT